MIMAHPSQDIYRSREKKRDLLAADKPNQSIASWLKKSSRNPWSIVGLVVFVFVFFGVFTFIVVNRQRLLKQAETEGTPALIPEAKPAVRAIYPLDLDPSSVFTESEFNDLDTRVIPDGGAIRLTPDWVKQAGLNVRQAEAAFEEKNWASVVLHYERARAILPAMQGIDRWIGLAQLHMKSYTAAEASFLAEVAREPGQAGLHNNLGVARFGQGQAKTAELDFLEALRLEPGYAPAQRNLALLFYQTGRMTEAVEALDLSLITAPEDLELQHMKAVALIRLERWKDASVLLEAVAVKYPDVVPMLFRLAEVRAHLADSGDPMEALKRATALTDARRALVWINRSAFDPLRDRPEFQALVLELSQAAPQAVR